MEITEKAKEIRKELKKLGVKRGEVSVRVDGYIAIWVRIKSERILPLKQKIKEITKKYEKISYDKRTGEILSGGNDYVFVESDV